MRLLEIGPLKDLTYTLKIYVYTSTILLTKTTAPQNEVALSYRKVRGLYFLPVIFVRSI